MTLAPETSAEAERQRVLNVLGFPADEQLPALTALTRLAARQCDCVASAISVVAADRQVFISALGIDITDNPRAGGLFELTMGRPNGLVVPDARSDPRFTGNPLLALDTPA